MSGLAERLGRGARAARARWRGRLPARSRAQPLARRRARDPRPPHAGAARRRAAAAHARDGARAGPRRPARLQRRRARSPTSSSEMPVRRRRPRAADRRRERRRRRPRSRSPTASTCCATRRNRGYGARQKTGYVRALLDGADVDRDGPRRQPVRPGARGRDGRADPRRRGRHGDRLAAARRPRDRRRHAALEVGRQPAADRDREPRLRRALLRVPHRLPRVLGADCCARSRSCATPTTSSSTRRSSPRCWRAARACVEIPIPTRYFHEASSVDFAHERALRVQDALGARALRGSTAARALGAAAPPGGAARSDARPDPRPRRSERAPAPAARTRSRARPAAAPVAAGGWWSPPGC